MQLSHALLLGLTLLGSATFLLLNRSNGAEENQAIHAFKDFMYNQKIVYASEVEKSYRLSIFIENYLKVIEHNADTTKTYKVAINEFSDLTQEEFKGKYLMKSRPESLNKLPTLQLNKPAKVTPIDWSTKNVLPAVKDQGQCGSCWAFSTAAVLESTFNIHNAGTVKSFAEQQLVDCCGAKGFGCEGCNGAWPTDAIKYVQQYGIVEESEYEYTAQDGTCDTTKEGKGFKPSAQYQVKKTDADLQTALQIQPISICVDAMQWSSYSSGIFNDCSSDPSAADHAVLLVGFDKDNNWIVRNSWSASWGNKGHITLAPGNTCGVENYAIYTAY